MMIGRHYQNAYVTRDVDKAVADLRPVCDIRKLMEIEVNVPVWTPKGDGHQVQKLAFVWIDDLNLELIQPISGDVELYRDWLPDHDGLRFHHACFRVDDWDATMAAVNKQSAPIVLKGSSGDALKFIYLDTRPLLGHYTEYVWMNAQRWEIMGGR